MRVLCLCCFFLTVLSAKGQSYQGDDWSQANASKHGTITLAYVETPGFVYKDGAGQLTGICIDVINDFLKYIRDTKGVNLTTKWTGDGTDFKGMYDGVKTARGGVFGLGNITITEDRRKEVLFSPPFIKSFALLVTQSTVPMLTRLEDLPRTFGDMTAYTAKGTINGWRIEELKKKYYPAMKINYLATSQEALEKILLDQKGFAYLDLVFYLEAVQRGKPVKRHPIGDKPAEEFGFIMPKTSDWSGIVQEFFEANGGYVNSTPYKNILIKHLGQTGLRMLQSAK
jgi:ABC-type amino acid transport substrate-binding protein